jgi:hypothetical protein
MLIPDPVSAQLSSAAAVTPREVADEHLRLPLLLIFLVSARGLLAWVVLATAFRTAVHAAARGRRAP